MYPGAVIAHLGHGPDDPVHRPGQQGLQQRLGVVAVETGQFFQQDGIAKFVGLAGDAVQGA